MNRSKIEASHLDRNAYVYVRQSTKQQVLHHLESQQRQYATLQPHGTTPFARAWGQGNGLNDFCMLPELGRPVEQVVSAA